MNIISIAVEAEYPSVATMVVSSEYDVDRDISYIRITNTLDDTYVNIDPNIELCLLIDAIFDIGTKHANNPL